VHTAGQPRRLEQIKDLNDASTGAAGLVDRIRGELQPVRQRLLTHPYVRAVEEARLDLGQLRPFVGEQFLIISSDLRSVAHLVSRFGGDFFLDVLEGESAALRALPALSVAVGMSEEDLLAYEPRPRAHAYAAYMAWLAAYASDAEVAAAYVVNFEAWGQNCGRLARALRAAYGLGGDQLAFFDLFAEPVKGFEQRALEVVAAGLARGVPERLLRRAPRMLQEYEVMYWDTLYEALS
jgi:pyrroloquinoline quinone (PQQ) biosynthesis protein C